MQNHTAYEASLSIVLSLLVPWQSNGLQISCTPYAEMHVRNLVTIEFAFVSTSNRRRCQHCGMLYFAMCVMPGHRDTRPKNIQPEPHPGLAHVWSFFSCLRFDQVLKNLLAVPWHGSLEQCKPFRETMLSLLPELRAETELLCHR